MDYKIQEVLLGYSRLRGLLEGRSLVTQTAEGIEKLKSIVRTDTAKRIRELFLVCLFFDKLKILDPLLPRVYGELLDLHTEFSIVSEFWKQGGNKDTLFEIIVWVRKIAESKNIKISNT